MEPRPTPNVLTGREGEPFDLELSAIWTKNYRDRHPGETISHFFGKEIIEKIMAQEGCLGIRIYYANNKPINGWQRAMVAASNFMLKVIGNIDGEKHIIITGATSNGNDMLHTTAKPSPAIGLLTPNFEQATIMVGTLSPHLVDTIGQQAMPCPGSPGCPHNILTSPVS